MAVLSKDEVTNYLSLHLKNWKLEGGAIRIDLKFKTFVEAFSFMTAVALEAEKMDHHPDWSNVYNKVSIALSTHSANGITRQDFDLADRIDSIYKKYEGL
jgi:4a-hydroxytetrahydrobiopterin dehydratase